jgi:hypothetical protein
MSAIMSVRLRLQHCRGHLHLREVVQYSYCPHVQYLPLRISELIISYYQLGKLTTYVYRYSIYSTRYRYSSIKGIAQTLRGCE